MSNESGAGALYDTIGLIAYYWGWTDEYVLKLPVRRRNKFIKVLLDRVKKFGLKSFGVAKK